VSLFIFIHPRLPHIAVIAVAAATLLSPSPLPPYHCPCRRLPVFPSSVVNCCLSHHRLVVVSWVPIYPAFHHEPIQIYRRRILKKVPQGSKQRCNKFGLLTWLQPEMSGMLMEAKG
jgi:hypothetical protein